MLASKIIERALPLCGCRLSGGDRSRLLHRTERQARGRFISRLVEADAAVGAEVRLRTKTGDREGHDDLPESYRASWTLDPLGAYHPAAKQGDAGAQISTALKSGDRQLAERIAHTVKGVAGNIGIVGIQTAAQRLEKAIREGQDGVAELLSAFATSMTVQVRAIEQSLRNSAPAPTEAKSKAPFDGEAAAVAVARLKSLLEASDGDAEQAFRALQETVAGAVQKSQLDALGTSINDFDFETALRKLDEIAESCKQTEDQAK